MQHDFPSRRTHDLAELGSQCESLDASIEPICRRTEPLTVYAWVFHYPGDVGEPARGRRGGSEQSLDMKFIVDINVGRLAVWLRALGYDTLFINPIEDDALVEIARNEERVILTKDTGILRRRVITSGEVKALRVDGDGWRQQLAQVVRELHLAGTPSFTLCMECNTPLEMRTREEARAHVPPFVHRTQQEFLACPACGRYYWKGTHWKRMREELGS